MLIFSEVVYASTCMLAMVNMELLAGSTLPSAHFRIVLLLQNYLEQDASNYNKKQNRRHWEEFQDKKNELENELRSSMGSPNKRCWVFAFFFFWPANIY